MRTLIGAYLRLPGPATAADVAACLGTRLRDLAAVWADDLVEVDVEDHHDHLLVPVARVDEALGGRIALARDGEISP